MYFLSVGGLTELAILTVILTNTMMMSFSKLCSNYYTSHLHFDLLALTMKRQQSSLSLWCTSAKRISQGTASNEVRSCQQTASNKVRSCQETASSEVRTCQETAASNEAAYIEEYIRSDTDSDLSSTRDKDLDLTTSDKDTSTSDFVHDSEEERITNRDQCEFFHKRDGGKVTRRFVRCKVCTSYPSVVALHCHRQRIPPIARVGGTRYREGVASDHEKHQCHDAAVKAKRRSDLQKSDRLSVPIFAAMRHKKEGLFMKIGAYRLDVYNDAKRGTLSAWSWPSRVLTRYMANEVKIGSFNAFIPNQIQYLNPVQHRELLADIGRKNTA